MKRLLLLLPLALLSGCFPTAYTYTPRVSGTVLDATNNTPIAGARVSCTADSHGAAATVTDGTGHFILEADRTWSVEFMGMPKDPAGCDLNVAADRYTPQKIHVIGGDARVITVTLSPLAGAAPVATRP